MEKEPVNSEEKKDSSEDGRGKINEWLTENLRMIVSVIIVLVIAGGIYAYSKRTQAPSTKKLITPTEESSEGKISVIGGETETSETGQQQTAESAGQINQPSEGGDTQTVKPQTSQETENSFVETATRGDGTTNLARRALANYLEKNPDPSLTAEHKIFIEDFLRRQVADGRLKIGDKREFSKEAIKKAIEKSKSLNERQLKNLQKFAKKVPELK